ncbi:MAG: BrnT family toxin [Acetobacteraceae bacterium]|nr:BrnT family toxin [Acetobacteraceae bacterium]
MGFERAAEILEGQTIEWPDERREYGEDRIRALGESSGEVLHVVYTRRGDVVRIISVRRANGKERRLWQSRA